MKEDFDKKVRKDAQNTTKNDKNNSNSTKLDQNSSQNTTRADKNNANSTKLDQNQQKGDKNRQNSSQNTVKNEKNNIDTTKNDQNSNKNTVKSDKTRHKERVRTSYKLSGGAKAAIITLAITTGVLGAATIGLGVSTWQMSGQSSNYGTSLESIYQKTFYDLYDSVSSAEVNLSKAISASSSAYQEELLSSVAEEASEAQISISYLPLSEHSVTNTVSLINQLYGYASTLADSLADGEALSSDDLETLEKLHDSLAAMKQKLGFLSDKMAGGYNILRQSLTQMEDGSAFSLDIAEIESLNADYPTMIYDGPFSDSVTNAPVKGVSGEELSQEDVREKIASLVKEVTSLDYVGQTKGKFETYNYSGSISGGGKVFIQATVTGGNLLTMSGFSDGAESLSEDEAEALALELATDCGIENCAVVWQQKFGSDMYFNIAPKQDSVVLYPDLVKVKISLDSGKIVGYDATSYYTNHTDRQLAEAQISAEVALENIGEEFEVTSEALVLAPLSFNREVLCYEFGASYNGEQYYFYINAVTGEEENILKVIETQNGNLLQ